MTNLSLLQDVAEFLLHNANMAHVVSDFATLQDAQDLRDRVLTEIDRLQKEELSMSKQANHIPDLVNCGEDIQTAYEKLSDLARRTGEPVSTEFNGQIISAAPWDDSQMLTDTWHKELLRQHEAFIQTDEYRIQQAQRIERARIADAARCAALVDAPPPDIIDDDAWVEWELANPDPYGGRIMSFAEDWARLMQVEIAKGRTVAECAEECARLADHDGITGFMYGAAKSVLVQTWRHGAELKEIR